MKKISLLCVVLLLLSGCSAGPNTESSAPSAVPVTPSARPVPTEEFVEEEPPQSPMPSETLPLPIETPPAATGPLVWDGRLETLTLADFPTVLATEADVAANDKPIYLVAQVDGEDIRLYGLSGGQGLILRVDDMWQYFDLSYHTIPQVTLPQIAYGDYDGDMQFEVALQIYADGGSWGSLYDLHIVELNTDGIWIANWFRPDDFNAILAEMLVSSYDAERNVLTVSAGESSIDVDLTAQGRPDPGTDVSAYAAPMVHFTLQGDVITASFGIGVSSSNINLLAHYAGSLSATVVYTGSAFGLADLALSAD